MITAIWLGILAVGAALLHLAAGAGAPPAWLAILVAIGTVELGWGVLTLRRGALTRPLITLVGATAAILISAVAAISGAMPWLVLIVVLSFDGAIAVITAFSVRSVDSTRRARAGSRRPGTPLATILSFVGSAVVVAALATPALAATEAGAHAVPHGQMHEDGAGTGTSDSDAELPLSPGHHH
ncbi:hypothetical protein [Microbacterium sp. NPDC076895]|jgi:hypothetical protein|uniref:hypothetical protein n=1 Tax=Microbacterium sp. NPDC076895 TaxID=3154957 RepID=UPI003441A512